MHSGLIFYAVLPRAKYLKFESGGISASELEEWLLMMWNWHSLSSVLDFALISPFLSVISGFVQPTSS
jgi:hypothetical protein